jgi:hypothetical protein
MCEGGAGEDGGGGAEGDWGDTRSDAIVTGSESEQVRDATESAF